MQEKHNGSDPAQWVELHSDRLYRYALSRMQSPEVAQDLVQETFYAAFKAHSQFRGDSSEFSWLMSILKNKIMDFLRQKYKSKTDAFEDIENLPMDQLFDPKKECHKISPSKWSPNPVELLENKEFWKIFEMCLGKLAHVGAQAFTMREVENIKSEEICNTLNISASNLYTILHRTRSLLRYCMDKNWIQS